jgi:surfeit locus 1 family protein
VTNRIPAIPTLLVLMAVGVMIRLGFWQLDRLHQKEALLAQYEAAIKQQGTVDWPGAGDRGEARQAAQYRKTQVVCTKVNGIAATAGHNAHGEIGWAHVARCETQAGYPRAEVVLGWSQSPASPDWNGGEASGTFMMRGQYDARLIADPPLAGLSANARPDPNDIPNNHLSYAVQWFLFAATALVIYGLALRKRLAAGDEEG